jgi:hypothetical protein
VSSSPFVICALCYLMTAQPCPVCYRRHSTSKRKRDKNKTPLLAEKREKRMRSVPASCRRGLGEVSNLQRDTTVLQKPTHSFVSTTQNNKSLLHLLQQGLPSTFNQLCTKNETGEKQTAMALSCRRRVRRRRAIL